MLERLREGVRGRRALVRKSARGDVAIPVKVNGAHGVNGVNGSA